MLISQLYRDSSNDYWPVVANLLGNVGLAEMGYTQIMGPHCLHYSNISYYSSLQGNNKPQTDMITDYYTSSGCLSLNPTVNIDKVDIGQHRFALNRVLEL